MVKNKKVLIIEDDKESLEAILIILRRLRWEKPLTVSTGDEALKLLKEIGDQIDLIILDYGLPSETNGLEVLAKAKMLVRDLPPVIMVTGEYDSTVKVQATGMNVTAFFMKSELQQMKQLLIEIFD